jgi:RimJ/RimL family protein N-acetyltransferase
MQAARGGGTHRPGSAEAHVADRAVAGYGGSVVRTSRRLRPESLTTERLALDPLRVEHAEEMAPLLDDPRLHAYIGGVPAGVDELRERYRRQVRGRSPDGSQQWLNWVVRRRDSGHAVGTVQATIDASVAEVAWVVASSYQRRGYAREAAAEMLRWLHQHGITMVIAHVHPEHSASIALARSLGLRPTTRTRDGEVRWEG